MELEVGLFPSSPGVLHPLLIPEVVENVFNFCSFKDLTSCRLVSKVWHDNSLERWRSLGKVRLVGGEGCRQPITRFLKFVKDEKRKPGSFKPYSGHFIIGMVKNLDAFFQEFRFQISGLELKNVSFNIVGDLRKVIFQSCPNMKELTLLNPIRVSNCPQFVFEPDEWMAPQFGENWNLKRLTLARRTDSFGITRMEILSHFPALEALIQKERSVRGETWRDSDDALLFYVVQLIRKHDSNKLKLRSIEDLEISQPVTNDGICLTMTLHDLLATSPYIPIEHLAVVLDGCVEDAEFILFYQICQHRDSALRKLDLLRTPGAGYLRPSEVFISEIWNLKELTLRSRLFSSLGFLKFMPNLKKLTIYGWDDGYLENIVKETRWDELGMSKGQLVMDKCTELNLAFHMDKKDLEKIVGIFPNVKKVTISLENEMFAMICGNWDKLVELNVFDSSLDDVGITGLSDEELASANGKRSFVSSGEARERTPNISRLRNLRRISISNWERVRITRSLGHASATYGFQLVPYLDYLHITNYNVEEDVKESLRASATSCVLTSIHTSYVQSDEVTWLADLKKTLF